MTMASTAVAASVAAWIVLAIVSDVIGTELIHRTYLHTVLSPRLKNVTCQKCPPGTYFVDHCKEDLTISKCMECSDGTFQPDYNLAYSCAKCATRCLYPREEIEQSCTKTSNLSCKCMEGYYRLKGSDGICSRHDRCPPGQGVARLGDGLMNTECAPCEEGYFSANESATEKCQPSKVCPSGHHPKQPWRPFEDTICMTNEEGGVSVEEMQMIGIVVGVVAVVLVLILVGYFIWRRKGFRGRDQRYLPKVLSKFCNKSKDSSDGATSPLKGSHTNGTSMVDGDSRLTKPNVMVDANPKVVQSNGIAENVKNSGPVYHRGCSVQSGYSDFTELPGMVGDAILQELSLDLIDKEWQFFFRNLFAESAESYIHEAIQNHPYNVREQIFQLLYTWKRKEMENATLQNLIQILQEQNKNPLVHKYQQKLAEEMDRKSTSTDV